MSPEFCQIARELLLQAPVSTASIDFPGPWKHMVLVEHTVRSQFDTLVNALRAGFPAPHGLLCLAGSGKGFHGQWNRVWSAMPGNIHLSVFLTPGLCLNDIGAGLTVLPAVSLVQALDTIPGLENRSGIKWVNDILVDGSKIAGFLVHTQSSAGRITGAVIGIGLNVETTPPVAPTKFVPSVTALCDHVSDPHTYRRSLIFQRLLHFLAQNYEKLVNGRTAELLEMYRERSLIMGRSVHVYRDLQDSQDLQDFDDHNAKTIAVGKVLSIGNNLELFLEGEGHPVHQGRLVMELETAKRKFDVPATRIPVWRS
jgi:biotin-[acetyl-CoA-carboxylase] ligase BirA-like protein